MLLPEKCIYWPAQQTLILSDWHIGKSAHFRSQGIPLPEGALNLEMKIFTELLQVHEIKTVVFLGDVFHAQSNSATQKWLEWIQNFPLHFIFIEGNHDTNLVASESGIIWYPYWEKEGVFFRHIADEKLTSPTLSGHWHPGVRIHGTGKQQMTFPCFYQKNNHLILPSFGLMTGANPMPGKNATAYAIVSKKIREINL